MSFGGLFSAKRRQKEQRLGRDSELLYATQQRQGGMELKKRDVRLKIWMYSVILYGFYMGFIYDFTVDSTWQNIWMFSETLPRATKHLSDLTMAH